MGFPEMVLKVWPRADSAVFFSFGDIFLYFQANDLVIFNIGNEMDLIESITCN